MPMIDVYSAPGTFTDSRALAQRLAATLMEIEQVPDIPMFRSNTAAFVHELPAGAISNVDGAGNYVRFHVGMEKHRVRGTLKDLEKVLPPQFVRSHRSTIINVTALHEFVRTPFGDLIAVLRSGARLTVGRTFRRSVEAAFAVRL